MEYGTISRKDSKYMNQQINIQPAIAYYLTGFADGEGNFNISLRKKPDHTTDWQVILTFNISQKESYILSQFKKHFGCGQIQQRKSDGLFIYVVNNPKSLQEKIIPFFRKYKFLSHTKQYNFSIFCKIADLVFKKEHLNSNDLKKIIELRKKIKYQSSQKKKI